MCLPAAESTAEPVRKRRRGLENEVENATLHKGLLTHQGNTLIHLAGDLDRVSRDWKGALPELKRNYGAKNPTTGINCLGIDLKRLKVENVQAASMTEHVKSHVTLDALKALAMVIEDGVGGNGPYEDQWSLEIKMGLRRAAQQILNATDGPGMDSSNADLETHAAAGLEELDKVPGHIDGMSDLIAKSRTRPKVPEPEEELLPQQMIDFADTQVARIEKWRADTAIPAPQPDPNTGLPIEMVVNIDRNALWIGGNITIPAFKHFEQKEDNAFEFNFNFSAIYWRQTDATDRSIMAEDLAAIQIEQNMLDYKDQTRRVEAVEHYQDQYNTRKGRLANYTKLTKRNEAQPGIDPEWISLTNYPVLHGLLPLKTSCHFNYSQKCLSSFLEVADAITQAHKQLEPEYRVQTHCFHIIRKHLYKHAFVGPMGHGVRTLSVQDCLMYLEMFMTAQLEQLLLSDDIDKTDDYGYKKSSKAFYGRALKHLIDGEYVEMRSAKARAFEW